MGDTHREELAELWRFLRQLHNDELQHRASAELAESIALADREQAAQLAAMSEHGWEALRTLAAESSPSPCARAKLQHVLRYCRDRYQSQLDGAADDSRR